MQSMSYVFVHLVLLVTAGVDLSYLCAKIAMVSV
jgi:hypothetical protein